MQTFQEEESQTFQRDQGQEFNNKGGPKGFQFSSNILYSKLRSLAPQLIQESLDDSFFQSAVKGLLDLFSPQLKKDWSVKVKTNSLRAGAPSISR